MTEQSMFFSDGSYYSQNTFAKVWKDIFGHNGIVTGNGNQYAIEVNDPANMAVKIKTGRAYVQGYIHEVLTDPAALTIEQADPTNPRIDRIILRLDVDGLRKVYLAVLKGTAAASPVAPTLTQTDAIYEFPLYQITVRANSTSIISTDVTSDDRQYMWYQTDNLQKTSKDNFGIVKIGDGIEVVDGVASIQGTSALVNVASTGTTPIGKFNAGTVTPSTTARVTPPSSDGSVLISNIKLTPSSNIVTMYQGFVCKKIVTCPYKVQMSAHLIMSGSTQGFTSWTSCSLYRTKDNALIGSCGVSIGGPQGGEVTDRRTFLLPADFDIETETVYLYGSSYYLKDGLSGPCGDVGVEVCTQTATTLYLHE